MFSNRALLFISLVPGLLYRPGETLTRAVLQRDHWRFPLLVAITGIGILSTGLTPHVIGALQVTSREAIPVLLTVPAVVWTMSMVTMLVILMVNWLFQSFTLVVISRLGARPLSMRVSMAIIPWLWIPLALRMAVQGFYLLLGGILVDNGLSFLISRGQGLTPLSSLIWQFLWQWDPFFVWHLVLVGAILYRFARFPVSRTIDGAILYGLITAFGMALLAVWQAPG